MKKTPSLLLVSLLSFQTAAHSASVDIFAPFGNNGVAGTDGDPAGDGGHGSTPETADASVSTTGINQDTVNSASAVGGLGGHGGRGGSGFDGSDLNLFAHAGSGGDGANGGDARASATTTANSSRAVSATATSISGSGGNGGTAGVREDILGNLGADGKAGDGGSARSSASASNSGAGSVNVFAGASARSGGDISPNNRLPSSDPLAVNVAPINSNAAGNGGVASLGVVYGESLAGGSVSVNGSIVGGDGGDLLNSTGGRLMNLTSGNGANAALTDAVDGSTTGNLSLIQSAQGGNGGIAHTLSGYGATGSGGGALSSLTKETTSQSLNVETRANAGQGGSFEVLNALLSALDGSVRGSDGATAVAHSSATNLGGNATALATATGGQGGHAGSRLEDMLAIAGDGGNAIATAYAESVGGRARATARQTSGNGGFSIAGSTHHRSGNGADSIMVDAVSGSSDIELILEQTATAGSAGSSTFEATRGGNASSSLTARNAGGGHIQGTVQATGGLSGGSGDNTNIGLTNRVGGAAFATANLTGDQRVNVNVRSTGGAGSNTGGVAGGIGGNGGIATLGLITGTSLNGGNVQVTGTATGGNGGESFTSRSGNGASVALIDTVDGSTTGQLILSQRAEGGDAFASATRTRNSLWGLAGEAFSSLTRAVTDSSSLQIQTTATGGDAGGSRRGRGLNLQGVAADGALATARSSATNTGGTSSAFSNATGGVGGVAGPSVTIGDFASGNGGNAFSTSDTSVFAGMSTSSATANSTATGGAGGEVTEVFSIGTNLTTEGGNGGHADSVALATINGTDINQFSSQSMATGGNGGNIVTAGPAQGGDGGNAFAQATSVFNAQSSVRQVTANATAVAGSGGSNTGGGFGGRGGDATAIAEVIGAANASSRARATAGNYGEGNVIGTASASALINSGSGSAVADIGRGNGLVTQLSVVAQTRGTSPLANSNVEASLSVGNRASSTAITSAPLVVNAIATTESSVAATELESVTRVSVLPDANAISQVFSGNSDVASNFDLNGGSDVLALMTIGALQDGSIISDSFSNDVRLSMDMSQLSTQQDLIFGFMNPVITGNGFDSMTFQIYQENNLVVDELFGDALSASSFFNDQTLNLGDWTQGLFSDLDLLFLIDFDISTEGDGFLFDVAYGNSSIGAGVVPVPAAVWLFGSGFIALLGFARRRK